VLEVIDPPNKSKQPAKVVLHIKNECLYGEKISVQAKQTNIESMVTILKNENVIVAHATIAW
jgi:acyl-ACP thioesterase